MRKELVFPSRDDQTTGDSIDPRQGLPRHIGIIMDGNGRWAKARGLPRAVGHRQGAEALKEIVKECGRLAIPVLTVYAFSTENWRRPREEVDFLMGLLLDVLKRELAALHEEGVRIVPIGRVDDLPSAVQLQVRKAEELTADNDRLKLNMAISYGGRQEIVEAVVGLLARVRRGELVRVTEASIAEYLYTAGDPEPDLIIRTGGERRLSNFLLWQSAYSELYFTDTMWPEFSPKDFLQALADFQKRERRFGTIHRE